MGLSKRREKKSSKSEVTLTAKEVKALVQIREDLNSMIEDLQDMHNELEDILGDEDDEDDGD